MQKRSKQIADWVLVEPPLSVLPKLRCLIAYGDHEEEWFQESVSLRCLKCGTEQQLKWPWDLTCKCEDVDANSIKEYFSNIVGDLDVTLGAVEIEHLAYVEILDYSVVEAADMFLDSQATACKPDVYCLLAEYILSIYGEDLEFAPFVKAQKLFQDYLRDMECPKELRFESDILNWLLRKVDHDMWEDVCALGRANAAAQVCTSEKGRICFDKLIMEGSWCRSKLVMEALFLNKKQNWGVGWSHSYECFMFQRDNDGIIVRLVKNEKSKLINEEYDPLFCLKPGEEFAKKKAARISEHFRIDRSKRCFGLCVSGKEVKLGGNFLARGFGIVWKDGEKCSVIEVRTLKWCKSPVICPIYVLSSIKLLVAWLNKNLECNVECVDENAGSNLCLFVKNGCENGRVFEFINHIGTVRNVFCLSNEVQWRRPNGSETNWRKSGFILDSKIESLIDVVKPPSVNGLRNIHLWIKDEWNDVNASQALFAFGFGLMSLFRSKICQSQGIDDFPCCWMYSREGGAGKSTVSRMVLSLFGLDERVCDISQAKVFEKLRDMRDCLVVIDDLAVVVENKPKAKSVEEIYSLLHRIHDGKSKDTMRGSWTVQSSAMFCTNIPPPSLSVQKRRLLCIEFTAPQRKGNSALDRLNGILKESYHALPVLMDRVSFNSFRVARIRKLYVDSEQLIEENLKVSTAWWLYFTMEYAREVLGMTEEDVWSRYEEDILKTVKAKAGIEEESITIECAEIDVLVRTSGGEWESVSLVLVQGSNGRKYWSVKQLQSLDARFEIQKIAKPLSHGNRKDLQKYCVTLSGRFRVAPLVKLNILGEEAGIAKLCQYDALVEWVKEK